LDRARHAASGMDYLMDKGIVHRDLSLRNLLVTVDESGRYVVKVADFGLSRHLTRDYYKTDDKNIPVKWSAPEVSFILQFL
jgi:serine/threonine protein kinase